MKRLILACILFSGCVGHFQQPIINAQRIEYHDEMNAHVLKRLDVIEEKLKIISEKPPEEPVIEEPVVPGGIEGVWNSIPVPSPFKEIGGFALTIWGYLRYKRRRKKKK